MQVLCHRGWWDRPEQRNSVQALGRAFAAGLGAETDLRDLGGTVVISHDPPGAPAQDQATLDLAGLLALHIGAGRPPLALNIKADGLAPAVTLALDEAGLLTEHHRAAAAPSGLAPVFVFDMSVPDQLGWLRAGVPVFTRHSDVEPAPVLYEQATGVWLDDFGATRWWTAATVIEHLRAGKQVAVVSPELHGRDHRDAWQDLLCAGLAEEEGWALCTDLPAQAMEAFG